MLTFRVCLAEKKYRDQALKKLTVYLTRKVDWTPLEWDKLWKALFYCMWMSDKRPVQEELSSNLSQLVHKIPTPEAALAFVHSFFRTMHREWHGLDGLRLDKFYSLVRKFVHESVALLQAQDWDEELVEAFVTILSAEVVSQLPNGLRMHLADLYLTEIYGAAGKQVTTDAFVLLLEPFFALLGGEYDKTVFKRVRELVFEAMLTEYKFGPQPEKEEKDETDDEQGEEEEEEDKVFELVELAQVQHRIFAIASADDTAERNRAGLYTLYKKFFAVTKVDSLQAAQEEAANPTKKEKKPKKVEKAEKEMKEAEKPSDEAVGEKKKSKKARKRKAKQEAEAEVEKEVEKPEEVKETEPEAATPSKKSKKQKVSVENEQVDVEMATPVAEKTKTKKSKKEKKQKQEKVEDEAVVEVVVKESSPAKEKKPKSVGVTKSGQKFQRCGLCAGFGKGLVPKNKTLCGHCERSQKAQKKKNATASKKRKAEAQAQETQETADSGKKVTFGKSKALRHEVSVKRLKASAKKDAVSKTEDIKGVLKASSPSPVASKKSKKSKPSKGRKTAADFF
ncbi:hypothetical protein BBJ28_00021157 [Nothophytophthora sp. Chile5]|nr:hypothetical protein BBJ28_00021157 [Nothophytophthora sp. Chile5]